MQHTNWSEHKVKNKIKTAGYFIKRLKDNGFVVLKMFNAYSQVILVGGQF